MGCNGPSPTSLRPMPTQFAMNGRVGRPVSVGELGSPVSLPRDDGEAIKDLQCRFTVQGEDAKIKKITMKHYRARGINRLAEYGRWVFTETTNAHSMENVSTELAAAAPMDASMAARQLALAGGSEPRLEHVPRRRSVVNG